jgi:hypothetical protein
VNPIGGLVEGERRVYKPVFTTRRWGRADLDVEIAEHLTQRRHDEIVAMERELAEVVAGCRGAESVRAGEVLVDVPIKERGKGAGQHGGRVLVYQTRTDRGPGTPLEEFTPIMKSLKEQHREENRVCRVFVAPWHLEDTDVRSRIENAVLEYMKTQWDV